MLAPDAPHPPPQITYIAYQYDAPSIDNRYQLRCTVPTTGKRVCFATRILHPQL